MLVGWSFDFAFLIFSLFFLALGLLLVISPKAFAQGVSKIGKVTGFPQLGVGLTPGATWWFRFLGFFFLIFGITFLTGAISGLWDTEPRTKADDIHLLSQNGVKFGERVIKLLFLVGGAFLLFKPQLPLRWIVWANRYEQEVSFSPRVTLFVRLIGLAWIIGLLLSLSR